MYIYMCMSCRVVSDDRPRRTTACVRYYGEPIERAFCFFCHRCVGRCCTNRLHGCIVCECMESLCVYIVVHAHRARACEWDATMGCDGMHSFIHSFIHSSVVDARGDGRERRTDREDRHRSHRTHRTRLSLSLASSSIDSNDEFIHSFIPLRTNERTKGRTNEGTTQGTTRSRERDATRFNATIDAFVRIARDERYARLSRTHDASNASNRAFILNHPPETIEENCMRCMRE